MFTGIIQGTGTVKSIDHNSGDRRRAVRLVVDLAKKPRGLERGQSVALNGVCLTAVDIDGSQCTFELVDETIRKTSLGGLQAGSTINIERSLKVGDRLEGHFVLGHVDGRAVITRIQNRPGEVRMWFRLPKRLAKYVVKKGSISLDGISLTIVSAKKRLVSVSVIPHTMDATNLSTRRVGDMVNVETDILGKYILD